MKWFRFDWYKYLFSNLSEFDDGYFHKLQVIYCRMKGHPAGPVWYNPSGWEPDMTCKNCGDQL